MKEKINKISSILMICFLLGSFLAAPFVSADDGYETQAGEEMGIIAPSGIVEIGDTFTTPIYLDPGTQTDITTWKIYELTFNGTTKILNATSVSFSGFWDTAFDDPGTINNASDNITDIQSFSSSGTGTNYTACNVSWQTVGCGFVYINLSDTKIEDGDTNDISHFTNNISFNVYPQAPAAITVSTYNLTGINVSWTAGTGDDKIVLCGKKDSYPTGPTDSLLYNGTATEYNHSGLDNCSDYYYRIWGWNNTGGLLSYSYRQGYNTTECPNFPPTVTNPSPADGYHGYSSSITQVTLSVDISDAEGETISGWINCSGDSRSISGGNNTYSNVVSGLSSGTYTWYVNVTDGNSWTRESYTFIINTAPTGYSGDWNETPADAASSIGLNPTFSVSINDTEGDYTRVKFYWGNNNTQFGVANDTDGNGTVSVACPFTLSYETQYYWYVKANDSLDTTTSARWSFNTSALGVDIQAEWYAVPTNNTIHKFVNVTNTGAVNFTNVTIWDTPSSTLSLAAYNHSTDYTLVGSHHEWEIPFLNYTGENTWYNISIWFNLTIADNDTSFWNLLNVSHVGKTDSQNLTGLSYSFTVDKVCNVSYVNETVTEMGWTIWINNTGDFTLNNVYFNETYYPCTNYTSSSQAPEGAPASNETFLFASIAASASQQLLINTSVTAGCPDNGTRLYNNATVNTTEMTTTQTVSSYVPYGGLTETVRFVYNIQIDNMYEIGGSLQSIIGIMLIIGAIFIIVGMFYKAGYFGN